MNLAKTIYRHTLNLPDHAAREALDFVEFLEAKYGLPKDGSSISQRQQAIVYLQTVHNVWQGKPIEDRASLYDGLRD